MATHQDSATHQAIIIRYAESLLRSKLSALQTELEGLSQTNSQPSPISANPFVSYATMFTELSRLIYGIHSEELRERHHCSRTIAHFRERGVHILRIRRAPSVIGDETKQLASIKRFCEALPQPQAAHFRTRSSRFVMTLEFEHQISKDITHVTLAQHPERVLIEHLSESRLLTYVLLLSCQETGVHVRCKGTNTNRLSFSWDLAQQLQLPLGKQI